MYFDQLRRLTMRTGDEHLLITTRGSNKVFHKPFVFASSNRVVEFFSNAYKEIPVDMGYRMDAFMVSGIEGLARTQVQVLQQLKKDIGQLIFRKLREWNIYYFRRNSLNIVRQRSVQETSKLHGCSIMASPNASLYVTGSSL